MGTMDRGGVCTTDGANANDSPGYFGHIALARPVYHIGFIKTVVRVLRCVSYHTSRLLVDKVRRAGCASCFTSGGTSGRRPTDQQPQQPCTAQCCGTVA